MSSSLSAFAFASYGASLIASEEFPYLPIASTRGDITVRDGDEYMDLSLGDWNDDDDDSMTLHINSGCMGYHPQCQICEMK